MAVEPMWWIPPSSHGLEDPLEQRSLRLEALRPGGVVRDDRQPSRRARVERSRALQVSD